MFVKPSSSDVLQSNVRQGKAVYIIALCEIANLPYYILIRELINSKTIE